MYTGPMTLAGTKKDRAVDKMMNLHVKISRLTLKYQKNKPNRLVSNVIRGMEKRRNKSVVFNKGNFPLGGNLLFSGRSFV